MWTRSDPAKLLELSESRIKPGELKSSYLVKVPIRRLNYFLAWPVAIQPPIPRWASYMQISQFKHGHFILSEIYSRLFNICFAYIESIISYFTHFSRKTGSDK